MGTDLVAAYLRHARAAGFSTITVTDRAELLRRVDMAIPGGLAVATLDDLECWLGREGWSTWTRITYYGHIRGFFTWRASRTGDDPSADLVRPRSPAGRPKPVTRQQLLHALTTAADPWRRYIALAAYAGARAGEVAALHSNDVTEQHVWLTGKGGKRRAVPMRPEVWAAIGHIDGPIARKVRTGEPASANTISVCVKTHLRRIGLPQLSLHPFRHWFGTWMLMPRELGGAGADLRTVQELMGHADPATTALYTQVTDEQRRHAVAGLPSILGSGLTVVRDVA